MASPFGAPLLFRTTLSPDPSRSVPLLGEHSSADVADRSSSSRGGGAVGGARTSLSSLEENDSGGEEASQPPSPSGLASVTPEPQGPAPPSHSGLDGPSGGARSLPRSTLKSTPRCDSPAISTADRRPDALELAALFSQSVGSGCGA